MDNFNYTEDFYNIWLGDKAEELKKISPVGVTIDTRLDFNHPGVIGIILSVKRKPSDIIIMLAWALTLGLVIGILI